MDELEDMLMEFGIMEAEESIVGKTVGGRSAAASPPPKKCGDGPGRGKPRAASVPSRPSANGFRCIVNRIPILGARCPTAEDIKARNKALIRRCSRFIPRRRRRTAEASGAYEGGQQSGLRRQVQHQVAARRDDHPWLRVRRFQGRGVGPIRTWSTSPRPGRLRPVPWAGRRNYYIGDRPASTPSARCSSRPISRKGHRLRRRQEARKDHRRFRSCSR